MRKNKGWIKGIPVLFVAGIIAFKIFEDTWLVKSIKTLAGVDTE